MNFDKGSLLSQAGINPVLSDLHVVHVEQAFAGMEVPVIGSPVKVSRAQG
jgi:hypothetical protein